MLVTQKVIHKKDNFDLFFPVYNGEILNNNLKKSGELVKAYWEK